MFYFQTKQEPAIVKSPYIIEKTQDLIPRTVIVGKENPLFLGCEDTSQDHQKETEKAAAYKWFTSA